MLQTSVTCKKSPKFAKMKALDPLKIVKNVGNLGIIIVATGFERLPNLVTLVPSLKFPLDPGTRL